MHEILGNLENCWKLEKEAKRDTEEHSKGGLLA